MNSCMASKNVSREPGWTRRNRQCGSACWPFRSASWEGFPFGDGLWGILVCVRARLYDPLPGDVAGQAVGVAPSYGAQVRTIREKRGPWLAEYGRAVSLGATHSLVGTGSKVGKWLLIPGQMRLHNWEYVTRVCELACRSQREGKPWRHCLQPDERPHV